MASGTRGSLTLQEASPTLASTSHRKSFSYRSMLAFPSIDLATNRLFRPLSLWGMRSNIRLTTSALSPARLAMSSRYHSTISLCLARRIHFRFIASSGYILFSGP